MTGSWANSSSLVQLSKTKAPGLTLFAPLWRAVDEILGEHDYF